MKAMLLPLTAPDAAAHTGDDAAPEKHPAHGFDAVLAMVAAQAANLSAPKPAPAALKSALTQQTPVSAPNASAGASASTAAPQLESAAALDAKGASRKPVAAADAGASAAFAPWLAGQIAATQPAPVPGETPVAGEQPAAPHAKQAARADGEREPGAAGPTSQLELTAVSGAQLVQPPAFSPAAPAAPAAQGELTQVARSEHGASATVQLLAAQAVDVTAPSAAAFQAQLQLQDTQAAGVAAAAQPAAPGSAPLEAHGLSTARPGSELLAQSVAAGTPSAQSAAQPLEVPVSAPVQLVATAPLHAPSAAAEPASKDTPLALSSQAPALQSQSVQVDATPVAVPAAPASAGAQALPGAAHAHAPQTSAAVVEPPVPTLAPVAAAEHGAPGAVGAQSASGARKEEEEEPALELAAAAPEHERSATRAEQMPVTPAAPVTGTQSQLEVQGARGLEAVVASLLRAGSHASGERSEAPRASAPARLAPAGVESVAAVRAASARVELASGTGDGSDSGEHAARKREQEQTRDMTDVPLLHVAGHLPPARDEAPADVGSPQPSPSPAQPVDPEATLAGKLGHGHAASAASISIDHPELGEMDLVVQNQNGRIEVRAVLETPHAAQVLRAHESALRYGIQQAGMTFGALRVRARTGDGETVKARDITKRRRDHEWEA